MKVLLSWLRDYVDINESAEQVADILSDLGLATEGIEQLDGGDAVIDLEVTSNRGDCLGHIGVAREFAAATHRELRLPDVTCPESQKQAGELCSVQIDKPDLCGRYTARVIESVTVGPTPDWMSNRLEAIGVRTVSNVVDATNYAMMETSQPPHAFDYTKITEGKIIVRKAKPGERIISIDGSKCDLQPDMLIIADPSGPVAVAGVMGGLETEVSEQTTSVLLEDAYFDPVSVRATSRSLQLPSEAAFRFERIVDIEQIDWASKRTAQLIVHVAGGTLAKGVVDTYPRRWEKKQVTMRLSRLNHLLGIVVPTDEAVQILARLCFEPNVAGDVVTCTIPSWRSDVYREADLIEEVSRIYGLDKVPTEKNIQIEVAPIDPQQKLRTTLGQYLNGCGFYETINVTFVEDKVAELFGPIDSLSVTDESRKHANLLRTTLLGSLFSVLRTNLNARNQPCRVFEIADTFIPQVGQPLPTERTKLTLVCDEDLQMLRGVVEGIVRTVRKDVSIILKPTDLPWAEVGAEIYAGKTLIGTVGAASQKIKDAFDIEDAVACGAELDLNTLLELQSPDFKVKAIPRFPAVERDLSLLVDEELAWSQIANAVHEKATEQLEQIQFVGIYRGKGIPAGKKSVTLKLRFRDEDGTLTHETVDELEKAIVQSVVETTAAEIRTA